MLFTALTIFVSIFESSALIKPITPINPPDTTPPIISNVQATWINSNTVNVSWNTNEASYFNMVEYGKGKKYRDNISQQYNTNLTSRMIPKPSILLTNLKVLGVHHYRVWSCDLFNNCAYSKDYMIKKDKKEENKVKEKK